MKRLIPIGFYLCISATAVAENDVSHTAIARAPTHSGVAINGQLGQRDTTAFGAVLFRSDSAQIEQALWPVLHGAIALAKAHPDLVIELEGHADVRGSRNHNRTLSYRRVQSVTEFFVRNGVSPRRIRTRTYGESRASTNVSDEDGQIFDRRVTISLSIAEVPA